MEVLGYRCLEKMQVPLAPLAFGPTLPLTHRHRFLLLPLPTWGQAWQQYGLNCRVLNTPPPPLRALLPNTLSAATWWPQVE